MIVTHFVWMYSICVIWRAAEGLGGLQTPSVFTIFQKKKEHWTCCVGVYKSGPLMSTVYVATTVTIDVYTHYMRAGLANR